MARNPCRALIVALAVLAAAGAAGAAGRLDRLDRLDRFRELAASRLGLAQILDEESPAEAFREIYALLDDEIVESLHSGGPFAAVVFLQERLDAFAEAWGGISSLQLSLPAVWSEARRRGHGLAEVVRWMCSGPATAHRPSARDGSTRLPVNGALARRAMAPAPARG